MNTYDFSQALARKADSYAVAESLKNKACISVTDSLQVRMKSSETRTLDIINFINTKICPVIRIETMQ